MNKQTFYSFIIVIIRLGFAAISCEGPACKDGASMLAGEGTPEGSVGNAGYFLSLTAHIK